MDPTLTQSGQAADAKVTGDRLSVLPDAIVSSQSGEEIQLQDSSNRGLEGLKVYGKATQQRTTGAQLFNILGESNPLPEGVTIKVLDDGYIAEVIVKVTEQATPEKSIYRNVIFNLPDELAGKKVTLSNVGGTIPDKEKNACNLQYVNRTTKTEYFTCPLGGAVTVEIPEDASLIKLRILVVELNASSVSPGTYTTILKGVMLNFGDERLPWEPYTGGQSSPSPEYPQEITVSGDGGEINVSITGSNLSQSLILSTPNGLPGIPVTSSGNYTDADGQQWVCDEIDVAQGKYIQRIYKEDVVLRAQEGNDGVRYLGKTTYAPGRTEVISSMLRYNIGAGYITNGVRAVVNNNDVQVVARYENEILTEVDLMYVLKTPIETDLSPEEIVAYQSLHTYQPITNILTDTAPQAGIEVAYVADTKAYIDRRLDSIEAKIAATQTQIL